MRQLPVFLLLMILLAASQACADEHRPQKSYIHTDHRAHERDYRQIDSIIPADPEIFGSDSVKWESAGNGTERKVFFNDRLTMVLLRIDRPIIPGEQIACHYHIHDQITYVLEGKIKVKVGSTTREIGPGGCYVVPSNVHHGIITLTSKVCIMDVFTPTREDFRPKP